MELPKIPGGGLGKIAAIAIPAVGVAALLGKFMEWAKGKKAEQPPPPAQMGAPIDPRMQK